MSAPPSPPAWSTLGLYATDPDVSRLAAGPLVAARPTSINGVRCRYISDDATLADLVSACAEMRREWVIPVGSTPTPAHTEIGIRDQAVVAINAARSASPVLHQSPRSDDLHDLFREWPPTPLSTSRCAPPRLKPDAFTVLHRRGCHRCTLARPDPACPGTMLSHWWSYGVTFHLTSVPSVRVMHNYDDPGTADVLNQDWKELMRNGDIEPCSESSVEAVLPRFVVENSRHTVTWDSGDASVAHRADTSLVDLSSGNLVKRARLVTTIKQRCVIDGGLHKTAFYRVRYRHPTVFEVADAIPAGWFVATADIQNCFYEWSCDKVSRRAMGVTNGNQLARYTRPAFGISLSPACICLLTAGIADILRNVFGIPVVITYVDDFAVAAPTRHLCALALTVTTRLLDVLGLRYRKEKLGFPSQRGVFLGVMLDTPRRSLAVAQGKLLAMVVLTRDILRQAESTRGFLPAKQVRSWLGKLTWASRLFVLARPFVRMIWSASASLRRKLSYCGRRIRATNLSCQDKAVVLRYGRPLLRILQRPWNCRTAIRNPDRVLRVTVDAGDYGLGCIVDGRVCWKRAPAKHWLAHSSTWREVVATIAVLTAFRAECTKRLVEIVYDNASAALAVTRLSSGSHSINQLLAEIARLSVELDCAVVCSWADRSHNTAADSISKAKSLTDVRDVIHRLSVTSGVKHELVPSAPWPTELRYALNSNPTAAQDVEPEGSLDGACDCSSTAANWGALDRVLETLR